MIVFIALDNNYGMMFNHRRQSQDRILRENMLTHCKNRPLWMNSYSATLFSSGEEATLSANIVVDEDFLSKAAEKEYCYVEDNNLEQHMDQIHTLIVYKWNRTYPSDLTFNYSELKRHWKIIAKERFTGSSHDMITKEVWQRV